MSSHNQKEKKVIRRKKKKQGYKKNHLEAKERRMKEVRE